MPFLFFLIGTNLLLLAIHIHTSKYATYITSKLPTSDFVEMPRLSIFQIACFNLVAVGNICQVVSMTFASDNSPAAHSKSTHSP